MKITAIAWGVLAACSGGAALGQQSTIDIGVVNFQTNSASPAISGRFTPPGLNLSVGNATSLFLAYTRNLVYNFDFELDGGVPPKFDVYGKGPAAVGSVPYNGQVLASAYSFTPAAFINYRLFDSSSNWTPYAGVGVNYTHFYSVSSSSAGNAVNGGYTSLGLSDSWGAAAHIGVRFRVMDNLSVNAVMTMAHVKSTLTSNTAGNARETMLDIRPKVYALSVGYSF